jgi:hypothetical protein
MVQSNFAPLRRSHGRTLRIVAVVAAATMCVSAFVVYMVKDTRPFRELMRQVGFNVVEPGGYQVSGTNPCDYLRMSHANKYRLVRPDRGSKNCSKQIVRAGKTGYVGSTEIGFAQFFDGHDAAYVFKQLASAPLSNKPRRKLSFGDDSVGAWIVVLGGSRYEVYARYNNLLIDVKVSNVPRGGSGPSDLGVADIASMTTEILRSAVSELRKS